MYVYKQTETGLWTVGFYDVCNRWIPEKDCTTQKEAAERVHWLNGGRWFNSKLREEDD